jgi:hypothetical protein
MSEPQSGADFWIGMITAGSVVALAHVVAIQDSLKYMRRHGASRRINVVNYVLSGRSARSRETLPIDEVIPWESLSRRGRWRLFTAYLLFASPAILAFCGWLAGLWVTLAALLELDQGDWPASPTLELDLLFVSFALLPAQLLAAFLIDVRWDFRIRPPADGIDEPED